MVYVLIDDTYHDLLEGGVHTRCLLDVPYGTPYVSSNQPAPDGPLCGDCFPETDKGKRKKK